MASRVKTLRFSQRRLFAGLFTLAYFSAFLLTAVTWLLPSEASAAQLTVKSIVMSTSLPSAQVEYSLTFTPATTEAASSLVVDFCSNDPLPTDTCSFAATTVPTISTGITASTGTVGVLGSGSPIHTISLDTIALTSGTPFTVNFDATVSSHLTNPTTNTSFYARIITYSTNNGATSASTTGYVPANTTGGAVQDGSLAVDTGGDALSTAASIGITSNVYETLSFCVFTTACGTTPNLILGSATTGALSIATTYVNNNTNYTLATNAAGGVSVTMTGTTLCRPGGTCATGANVYTIKAIGNTAALAYPGGVGTEQFGMCVDTNGVVGTLAAQPPYSDTANACNSGLATGPYTGSSKFGFYDSTLTNGTNNAAGSQILLSTGDVPSYTGSIAFVGNIAATTASGIYTTSLNLVATGTF